MGPYVVRGAVAGSGSDGGNPVRTGPVAGTQGMWAPGGTGSDGGNPVRAVPPGGAGDGALDGTGRGGEISAQAVPAMSPGSTTATSRFATSSCTPAEPGLMAPGGSGSDGGNPVRTDPTGGQEGHMGAGASGDRLVGPGLGVLTGPGVTVPLGPGGPGGDVSARAPNGSCSMYTGAGPESGDKRPPEEPAEGQQQPILAQNSPSKQGGMLANFPREVSQICSVKRGRSSPRVAADTNGPQNVGQLARISTEIVQATFGHQTAQVLNAHDLHGQMSVVRHLNDGRTAVNGVLVGPVDPHSAGPQPVPQTSQSLSNPQLSGGIGGDVSADAPGGLGGSSVNIGEPEAKLRERMNEALASTFMHSVHLNEKLKQTEQEKARAMELGQLAADQAGVFHRECSKLAADNAELQSHAATLAAQVSAQAAAATHAASQAHNAEAHMAGAISQAAASDTRAATAARQLHELAAAVERERPAVLAQQAELTQLRSRVPILEAELAALQLTCMLSWRRLLTRAARILRRSARPATTSTRSSRWAGARTKSSA